MSWRLKRIEVKNFFSYRDAGLDIGPLTVLAGINGAGKSNLIRSAVAATNDAFATMESKAVVLLLRMMPQYSAALPKVFWYSTDLFPFLISTGPMTVSLGFDRGSFDVEWVKQHGRISRNELLRRNGKVVCSKQLGVIHYRGKRFVATPEQSLLGFSPLQPNVQDVRGSVALCEPDLPFDAFVDPKLAERLLTAKNPLAVLSKTGDALTDGQKALLEVIFSKKLRAEVVKLLARLFDYSLPIDLALAKVGMAYEPVVLERFREEADRLLRVPFHRLPDGTKKFLLLLTRFLHAPKGTTFLIEEPENHLHVTAVDFLVDFLHLLIEERGCQFLVTTHSPELVQKLDYRELVRVIRRRDGSSALERIDGKRAKTETIRYLAQMPGA